MFDQYLRWCDYSSNARLAGSKHTRYASYAQHSMQGEYRTWADIEWEYFYLIHCPHHIRFARV
jgi:hypothetical protein